MKRRSFLGLLGGAVVAPQAIILKARARGKTDAAWKLDVYQTPFMSKSPAYDSYVSDFGRVIIKRA